MKLTSLSIDENMKLVNSKQAAKILDLAQETLHSYRLRGYVESVPTTSNRIHYRIEDVEAYKIKRAQLKEQRKREVTDIV